MDSKKDLMSTPTWSLTVVTELALPAGMLASAQSMMDFASQGFVQQRFMAFAQKALSAVGSATPESMITALATRAKPENPYQSLRNALLYADKVYWLPTEMFLSPLSSFLPSGGQPTMIEEALRRDAPELVQFLNEIETSGAGSAISLTFDLQTVCDALTETLNIFCDAVEKGAVNDTAAVDRLFDSFGQSFPEIIGPYIKQAVANSRAFICSDGIFKIDPHLTKYAPWNSYRAATDLSDSMANLLLADVAMLPLEAIVELRDRLRDSLDPMRAEMLRLTETLRTLVAEKTDASNVQNEARNLIATRVEPVVREAARRANEMASAKWRNLFRSGAKAFGFTGAAFFNPAMLGKAISQTLETATNMFVDPDQPSDPMKATAEYVLFARAFLAETDNAKM